MYIIRNAFRSISRAKGRNILIGIIALVIAVSACIALSIREAAVKARENTISSLSITAQISVDRQSLMKNAGTSSGNSSGAPDKDSMRQALQGLTSPDLDELEVYAKAASVKSFYYTLSASLDAGSGIEPIDTAGTFSSDDSATSSSSSSGTSGTASPFGGTPDQISGQGGKSGMTGIMGSQGDFTIVGYSADEAMTDFISGTSAVSDGSMFTQGTSSPDCIISSELAELNSISVGSAITLVNPNNEDETVTLNVVGIYTSTADSSQQEVPGFSTSADSGNKILMSYTALKAITDASESSAGTTDDGTSASITSNLSGTYVFASEEDYNAFEAQARELGLDDKYTVSSSDLTQFENSMKPLENLSKIATYFLIVVFAIGAVILVVLNIFNIRERKYEIGVLTAIGMKKGKVALQFVTELFAVTLAAIILGAGIGAATSVPVTNALLESQIESTSQSNSQIDKNFGREASGGKNDIQGMPGGTSSGSIQAPPDSSEKGGGFFTNMMTSANDYVSSVSYSTDITVILQLIGVGILLTLISSLAAVTFIMRYEPLKILTSRD